MKTEAYTCDYCQQLRTAEECVGVNPTEDVFDRMAGYPIINNPAKADIHFCTTCYNMHVVSVAERETNRRKDEHSYELKLKEMSYIVRSQCVVNYNKKRHKIVAQVKRK